MLNPPTATSAPNTSKAEATSENPVTSENQMEQELSPSDNLDKVTISEISLLDMSKEALEINFHEDELLAIAKLSRPVLKTPSTELVIKVKLDI